jgi:hypothetical protein
VHAKLGVDRAHLVGDRADLRLAFPRNFREFEAACDCDGYLGFSGRKRDRSFEIPERIAEDEEFAVVA